MLSLCNCQCQTFFIALFLFQEKSSIILTSEVITDIQKGLTLGDHLLLPDELGFNASRMSFLLFPHGQMRPLQHIWLVYLHEFIVSKLPRWRVGGRVKHCATDALGTALGTSTLIFDYMYR